MRPSISAEHHTNNSLVSLFRLFFHIAKRFAHANGLSLFDVELEVSRSFEEQHDSAAHVELSQQFALAQFCSFGQLEFLELGAGVLVRANLEANPAVGLQLLVHVDLDRSDVGGSNGGEAKEPMKPLADVQGSFVDAEKSWQPSGDLRTDGEKFPGEVATDLGFPIGGRVEAMVVSRSEVNHALEDGSRFVLVHPQSLFVVNLRVVRVLKPAVWSEERIDSIINPLDLFYERLRRCSEMQDLAIGWGHQRTVRINDSSTLLQGSGEELRQTFIVLEIRVPSLFEIHPKTIRIPPIDEWTEARRNVTARQPTPTATDNSQRQRTIHLCLKIRCRSRQILLLHLIPMPLPFDRPKHTKSHRSPSQQQATPTEPRVFRPLSLERIQWRIVFFVRCRDYG